MPLVSVSTTGVSMECQSGDGGTWDIAYAALVAGTEGSKNEIDVSGCTESHPNGNRETLMRTFDNDTRHAAAINGLHRALVGDAQVHADWAAELAAEVDPDDLPVSFITIGATPIVDFLGVNGRYAVHVDGAYKIHGIAECQSRLLQGLIVTADEDADIGTFLTNVYPSDEAKRTAYDVDLKTKRGLYFP